MKVVIDGVVYVPALEDPRRCGVVGTTSPPKFVVGARVLVRFGNAPHTMREDSPPLKLLDGMVGIVRGHRDDATAVEFFDFTVGHNCSEAGLDLDENGQYIHEDDLVPLDLDELRWAAQQ